MRIEKRQRILLEESQEGKLSYQQFCELMPLDIGRDQLERMLVAIAHADVSDIQHTTQLPDNGKDVATGDGENLSPGYPRELISPTPLTRDQETALVRQLSSATKDLLDLVLSTPYAFKEMQMTTARILARRLSIAEVSNIADIRKQRLFVRRLPQLISAFEQHDLKIEAQEKRFRRSELSSKSRHNIERKITRHRTQQVALLREYQFSDREILRIKRKIVSLGCRLDELNKSMPCIEREVGYTHTDIHRMAVAVRRAPAAAKRFGVEKERILDAERCLNNAIRRIRRIEGDAHLDAGRITALITAIREKERSVCAARNELIARSLYFVVNIARKHSNNVMLHKAYQEGAKGLITAAQTFAPDRGYRFSAYAVWCIRRAIASDTTKQGLVLSEQLVKSINIYVRTKRWLFQRLDREPSLDEVATITGMNITRLTLIRTIEQEVESLDPFLIGSDTARARKDGAIDIVSSTFGEIGTGERIAEFRTSLTEREETILFLRFAANPGSRYTLQEIADILKITRERVRQIEARALRKIARACEPMERY